MATSPTKGRSVTRIATVSLLTRPSVATILTGLYPSSHGAVHKADILPDRVGVFPDDAFEASTSIDDPDAARADELAAEGEQDAGDEGDDSDAEEI